MYYLKHCNFTVTGYLTKWRKIHFSCYDSIWGVQSSWGLFLIKCSGSSSSKSRVNKNCLWHAVEKIKKIYCSLKVLMQRKPYQVWLSNCLNFHEYVLMYNNMYSCMLWCIHGISKFLSFFYRILICVENLLICLMEISVQLTSINLYELIWTSRQS